MSHHQPPHSVLAGQQRDATPAEPSLPQPASDPDFEPELKPELEPDIAPDTEPDPEPDLAPS